MVIRNIIINIVEKTQGYCGFFVPWVLKDLGYNAGPLDGIWGKKSETALIKALKDENN